MDFKPATTGSSGNFDTISDDLLLYLFSFLPVQSVGRCAQICPRFFSLATGYQYQNEFYERSTKYIQDRVFQLLNISPALRKVPLDQIPLDLVRLLHIPEDTTNDEFPEILKRCSSRLTALDLGESRAITEYDEHQCMVVKDVNDGGIWHAAPYCKTLTSLRLQCCGDFSMMNLSKHCTNLQDLRLNNCDVSDIGMEAIAPSCANLVCLHLKRCNITDRGMTAIAPFCTQLIELHLESVNHFECLHHLTDATLQALASYCNNLRVLFLSEDNYTNDGILALAPKCHALTQLHLKGSFTDLGILILALAPKCSELISLHLEGTCGQWGGFSEPSLSALAPKCSELKYLYLSGQFNDESLLSLGAHCSKISELTLHGNFGNSGLEAIAGPNYGTLEQLNIESPHCTDQGILTLAPLLDRVNSLYLPSACTDITLQALAEHCVALNYLNAFSSTSITKRGIKEFRSSLARLQRRKPDQIQIVDNFLRDSLLSRRFPRRDPNARPRKWEIRPYQF